MHIFIICYCHLILTITVAILAQVQNIEQTYKRFQHTPTSMAKPQQNKFKMIGAMPCNKAACRSIDCKNFGFLVGRNNSGNPSFKHIIPCRFAESCTKKCEGVGLVLEKGFTHVCNCPLKENMRKCPDRKCIGLCILEDDGAYHLYNDGTQSTEVVSITKHITRKPETTTVPPRVVASRGSIASSSTDFPAIQSTDDKLARADEYERRAERLRREADKLMADAREIRREIEMEKQQKKQQQMRMLIEQLTTDDLDEEIRTELLNKLQPRDVWGELLKDKTDRWGNDEEEQ